MAFSGFVVTINGLIERNISLSDVDAGFYSSAGIRMFYPAEKHLRSPIEHVSICHYEDGLLKHVFASAQGVPVPYRLPKHEAWDEKNYSKDYLVFALDAL